MLRHLRGEALRGLALVEFGRAVLRDPLERLRQLRLRERLADLEEARRSSGRCASIRASAARLFDPFRLSASAYEIGKPLRRQLHRRRQVLGPLPLAVLGQRHLEAADGAGDARRPPSFDAVARQLALRVEVHVARRLLGRALAEVDERRTAVGHADQHVAAAAEVAGERMRDRHREADRDRGVHRVAAGLQHRDAHVGRDRLHGDHHAVPRAQRLTDGVERDGEDEDQAERQGTSHGDSL